MLVLGVAYYRSTALASLHDVLFQRAHDGLPLFNDKAWGDREIGAEEVRDVVGKAGEQRSYHAVGATSYTTIGEWELEEWELNIRFVAESGFGVKGVGDGEV